MIYEKNLESINYNFIKKNIEKYKKQITLTDNVNDLLTLIYKIIYKFDYYLNIIDYSNLDLKEKNDIIDILNVFNNEILSDSLTIDNRAYHFLQYFSDNKKNIDSSLINFYNFYKNTVITDKIKIKISKLFQVLKKYKYDTINIIVKDKTEDIQTSVYSTTSAYKILKEYEYELFSSDSIIENSEVITLLLKPRIYDFLNTKLTNRKSRSILYEKFSNQFNVNNKNNPLYIRICLSVYENYYLKNQQENLNEHLIKCDNNEEIEKFIHEFNSELNDNYINNYIELFKRNNVKGNVIYLYDVNYYNLKYKNKLDDEICRFDFDKVLNYIKDILKKFKIELKNIEGNKFNVYFNKSHLAQWFFNFNKENGRTNYEILFNRIKTPNNKINIVYLKMNFNCSQSEINFNNLCKLFGFIGYSVYYTVNLKDFIVNKLNKKRLFKSFFKCILCYNIEKLLTNEKDITKNKNIITEYLNFEVIFKLKKHLFRLISDIKIFYNKSFMADIVKIVNNEKDNQYLKIVEFFKEKYNKCFHDIYNTENYTIEPDLSSIFKKIECIKIPLVDYDIIISDIYSSELFYNYTKSKFDFYKLFKYINDTITIEKLIGRTPDFKTLIYGTIENHKEYKTLTEGINKIIDTSLTTEFTDSMFQRITTSEEN